MITALIVFLGIFLVGMLIPHYLVRSFLGPVFRIFVIPGVILHELAHSAACLITGAKIHGIRFFKRDGGDVTHEQSRIPIIGPLLITFAPLIVGFIAIILLAKKLLPDIDVTSTDLLRRQLAVQQFPEFFKEVIQNIPWLHLTSWLWLYFILSIGSTMTPSIQDLRNSTFPLILVIILIALSFRVPAIYHVVNMLAISALPALMVALFILLFLLVISLIVYTISRIFGIT